MSPLIWPTAAWEHHHGQRQDADQQETDSTHCDLSSSVPSLDAAGTAAPVDSCGAKG
jgi:hypothetical protein